MSRLVTLEGQLGDLTSKERNAIPRVCHLHLSKITAKIPLKTPKSFLISVCMNKTKSSIKTNAPLIMTPDTSSLMINLNIIFSYLHYFREINNKINIRLHKYKKPNLVYASCSLSLNEIFYSGFTGDLDMKGANEKKNFNKDLYTITCTIDSIPLEFNHLQDLPRFIELCKTQTVSGTDNTLETLDLFFDAAENIQEEGSDSEESNSIPIAPTPPESRLVSKNLSQKIQLKLGDIPEKRTSKENLEFVARDSVKKQMKTSGSQKGKMARKTVTNVKVITNDNDDSTDTEDCIKPLYSMEKTMGMMEKEEEPIVLLIDPKKRRSLRFYEAMGENVEEVIEKRYHFIFISDSEEMKKFIALLVMKAGTKEKAIKIGICGSDGFVSLFVRIFIEITSKKLKGGEGMFKFYYIPVGKTCELMTVLDGSKKYRELFFSEDWNVLFNTTQNIQQQICKVIFEKVNEVIQNSQTKKYVQLGEIQLTTENETVIVPFLKSICLTPTITESKPPVVAIDICKQKKDKQHVTKIKKPLSALDIIRLDGIETTGAIEKYGDTKGVLLSVIRKNDRKLLSCEQIIKTYCGDEDEKKKEKKKVEKKEDSPLKKEEKEESSANVSTCTKMMINCEDSLFSVFIDGRKFFSDVKYISVKNIWTGTKSIYFNTFV
ncbi:hypothetical protein CL6EHI_023620 [Entamoeba histolytica]|nr:hypothetical protein CL6EHI_023620 [Entamoeba histolytica]